MDAYDTPQWNESLLEEVPMGRLGTDKFYVASKLANRSFTRDNINALSNHRRIHYNGGYKYFSNCKVIIIIMVIFMSFLVGTFIMNRWSNVDQDNRLRKMEGHCYSASKNVIELREDFFSVIWTLDERYSALTFSDPSQ